MLGMYIYASQMVFIYSALGVLSAAERTLREWLRVRVLVTFHVALTSWRHERDTSD